jgi:acetoin utilization deacetylase AcuC-like enzyme
MRVGWVYDPRYLEHDTGRHPENAKRLEAIVEHIQGIGLFETTRRIAGEPATRRDVERIHTSAMLHRLQHLAETGGGYLDIDTAIGPRSYDVALLAAGGAIAATRAVIDASVQGAYALTRPPGHHATPTHSMGFCLLNNIAIAAAWALDYGDIERLAIVDIDVHHGNGTQDSFESDPRVLYISLHQYPHYPGTGHWRDTGRGEGKGTCINIPLPPQTGDSGYAAAFERLVEPALVRFHPQLILVSAGYDAHWADPLAWMLLSVSGYRRIVDILVRAARNLCRGRIVFVLEGGYHPDSLVHGVATTFSAMLNTPYDDVWGPAGEPESRVDDILTRIARHHGLA